MKIDTTNYSYVELEGSGELTLTHHDHAFRLVGDIKDDWRMTNFHFVSLSKRSTRIGKFIKAIPAVWKFCGLPS